MRRHNMPFFRIIVTGPILLALALLPIVMAAPAMAQVSELGALDYSTTMSSLASNSDVTVDYLGSSDKSGLVSTAPITLGSGSTANTITFSGTSGVYSGSTSGVSAAPVMQNGQPTTAEYLAAEPSGAITVTYASEQKYFGLLWGSVDNYNTLTFYDNGKEVGALTGSEITKNADGNQGAQGSFFVNVDVGNGYSFNKVVLTSSQPAFEFDEIAASQNQQGIDPAPLSLPGGTPAGMLVLGLGLMVPFVRRAVPA